MKILKENGALMIEGGNMRGDNGLKISAGMLFVSLAIVALFIFQYNHNAKANFKRRQAEAAIRSEIDQKMQALAVSSEKIKYLENQINVIRAQSENTHYELDAQRKKLLRRIAKLNKELTKVKNISLESLMKEIISKEERLNVKEALSKTLTRVEQIMAGDLTVPEQAVVTTPESDISKEGIRASTGSFTVIALDRRKGLIAINAGRNKDLKEGDRLILKRDDQEMASAYVVAVRYRVASAFIDKFNRNYTIGDLKEGDEVVIAEKK